MKNLETPSQNLDYNIPPRKAEKIWKNNVDKAGGMLDITYLAGQYSETDQESNQDVCADVRLYKKGRKEGYQLYVNDINIPKTEVILHLLHKLESDGLLIKSVNVQASHKSYDQMRKELIQSWNQYLDSLKK